MSTHHSTPTITDEQLQALRSEAAAHGDEEQVAVCARAMAGDVEALDECARVIAEAAAQDDEMRIEAIRARVEGGDIMEAGEYDGGWTIDDGAGGRFWPTAPAATEVEAWAAMDTDAGEWLS